MGTNRVHEHEPLRCPPARPMPSSTGHLDLGRITTRLRARTPTNPNIFENGMRRAFTSAIQIRNPIKELGDMVFYINHTFLNFNLTDLHEHNYGLSMGQPRE